MLASFVFFARFFLISFVLSIVQSVLVLR